MRWCLWVLSCGIWGWVLTISVYINGNALRELVVPHWAAQDPCKTIWISSKVRDTTAYGNLAVDLGMNPFCERSKRTICVLVHPPPSHTTKYSHVYVDAYSQNVCSLLLDQGTIGIVNAFQIGLPLTFKLVCRIPVLSTNPKITPFTRIADMFHLPPCDYYALRWLHMALIG